MPPSRRKSGNTAAQSTLSFNSKSARVTKPSAGDASTENAASKISEHALTEAFEHVQSEDAEPESEAIEVPIRQQAAKPVVVKDEAEEKAEKISDSQLKRYWKAEEDKRKAPRGNCSTRPTF
jgi:DNA polymerase delta subunit 4